MNEKKPKTGVGVMVFKGGRVLLARRKGAHGAGEYAFPGGHLEYGESFEACARREAMEECGIEIDGVEFLFVANVLTYMPKHYVHITLTANWKRGDPIVKEPEKSEAWDWFSLDALPAPMFEMCRLSFDSYRTGTRYYDAVISDHERN